MAKPIVVKISHDLGAAEAQARINAGLDKARADFSAIFSSVNVAWKANHADIDVVAVRQNVRAGIDVFDDFVRIEAQLPWYFAPLQNKISEILEKRGVDTLRLGKRRGAG
jgi:hypothetical protein